MTHRRLLSTALLLCLAASPLAAEDRYACVIDPSREVDLGSSVAGLIERIAVDRGAWVEKGDLVATLSADSERATVALLRARAESEAEVAAQAARERLARQGYDRARRLLDQGIGTLEALEEREVALEVARRDRAEADLRRTLAQLELRRARIALAQREIRAPISGFVTMRHLDEGEYLHPELALLTISQLDPLYVEAFVDARVYAEVAEGSVAMVHPSSIEAAPREAVVTVVDRVLDATSDTFGVRLELPNPDYAIPAGQRCEVAFPAPG
ncbi:efflux RND transporter periplasmic adaptor subunit [Roseisalinus antarcticus]|uniref:Efflux pump periplasmic linker BepF n=1 Tax=Roseisalinus antarcticus TaxID=254357 RepID=A0A1Y5TBM7_9RHOB|nr:efflux RND transporter periplasmic adaptor subunit [Roseisalinus antarcticus]SLN56730.1 Efflux pump periplasmic linker BepF [Roseisalinus antarcticus]